MVHYIGLFALSVAVAVGMVSSQETSGVQLSNQTVVDKINYVFPKDTTLVSVKESVIKFVHKVHDIMNEISEEKILFLENLEDDKMAKILRTFNTSPCMGEEKLQQLKKSFVLGFGLLEVPVREAISELLDKVNEMKRSFDMERSVLDVKLTTCELMEAGNSCPNISVLELPCLNDSCAPADQNLESVVFPSGKSADRNDTLLLDHTSPLSTDCEDGRFKCRNGQCIARNYACDGSHDCQDQSDEYPGCVRNCPGKRCRNLVCITGEQICNGVDDCGDGTDEENCITTENCNLRKQRFACSNKKSCLPLSALCDRKPDCADKSDEGRNCSVISGCDRCAALGGACLRSPSGPLCLSSCPTRFVFDLETGVCVLGDSTAGKRSLYKNYSFFGTVNKIKVLFRRLANGFVLMKKHLNQEIINTVKDLNICMQKNSGIVGGPFEILL